jgi:Calx-beta domain
MNARGRRRVMAVAGALGLGAALWGPASALAHSQLINPPSRDGVDANLNAPPCGLGGATRVGPQVDLTPGSTFTVTWNERIAHPPETFDINFSSAGNTTGFVPLKLGIAPGALGNQSTEVPLPNQETNEGTLQLVQNGSPAGTATYYSCANVRLVTPRVSIDDVQVTAGGTATFTISIPSVRGDDVTVNYATSNGTATAGSGFQAAQGTATIKAGTTSALVTVPTLANPTATGPQTFTVGLSGPPSVIFTKVTGTGTITQTAVADTTPPSLVMPRVLTVRLPGRGALVSFSVSAQCSENCRLASRLLLSRKVAKGLGIRARAATVQVGAGTASLTALKAGRVRVRLTTAAKKAFKSVRRLQLTLTTVATDASGNRGTVSTKVTLRR